MHFLSFCTVPPFNKGKNKSKCTSCFLLWLFVAIINMKFGSSSIKPFYYPLCGTGTSMFVLGLFNYSFSKQYKAVTNISKISYSIYLVHLTGVLIPLKRYLPDHGTSFGIAIILLVITLILIVSSFTYHIIERPFLLLRQRWLAT